MCSVFYDDYPVIEHSSLTSMTTHMLDLFLNLLGWQHATTGKKAVPFSPEMTVLGVAFDLSNLRGGKLKIFNKPGHLDRICALLQDIKKKGKLDSEHGPVLQGLLNFAGRFVLGRALKYPMHQLSKLMASRTSGDAVCRFCDSTNQLLSEVKPRYISILPNQSPILIYTDGAFEDGRGTWGAVSVDRYSSVRVVHHGTVPDNIMRHWSAVVGKQLICQIELFAFALVRVYYEHLLCNRSAIAFIDNEAARISLIKGSSPSVSMFDMVRCLASVDARSPAAIWFERVCTFSNIADLPSRDLHSEAARIIDGISLGSIPVPKELMQSILESPLTGAS